MLATGGIENSRILLLNEQNSKNLFASNMPIGKFWYEHPFAKLGKAIINEKKIINDEKIMSGANKNIKKKHESVYRNGIEDTPTNFFKKIP